MKENQAYIEKIDSELRNFDDQQSSELNSFHIGTQDSRFYDKSKNN